MYTEPAETITPENLLIKKTGTGGLPPSAIEKAQKHADSIQIDVMPYIKEKMELLKQQIADEHLLKADNDNKMESFLHDLVPFDVNLKLSKNNGLQSISSNLLRFAEHIENVNVDAFSVINAHIRALDIIISKEIEHNTHPILTALTTELQDACERYHGKYKE